MGKLREPFVTAIDFPLTGQFIIWPLGPLTFGVARRLSTPLDCILKHPEVRVCIETYVNNSGRSGQNIALKSRLKMVPCRACLLHQGQECYFPLTCSLNVRHELHSQNNSN